MVNENRLTEKHWNGKGYYMKCSGVLRCDGKCGDCDELDKVVDRLGEYEDKAGQAVDAVEVVRCKDCKYYHLLDEGFKDCRHPYGLNEPRPNDFCCFGEERKGNDKRTSD